MLNNVCVFGDSIAKGVVYDPEKKKYVFLGESFVNLLSHEKQIEILNFSKFGWTVDKGLQYVTKNKDRISGCDLVALEFGGNDCDFDWEQIAADPAAEHLPKTPIRKFVDMYQSLIGTVKQFGKKIIVLNLPPLDEDKYFRWISRGRNGENILKWLGGATDYIYHWQESYSVAISEIANAVQVRLIDIRSIFLRNRHYTDFLCEDGIHPNLRGHRLIADAINAIPIP